MYEILEYDSVLELHDASGQTAHLKRRQKVRFLQDSIIAYEDQVWGEGDLFISSLQVSYAVEEKFQFHLGQYK